MGGGSIRGIGFDMSQNPGGSILATGIRVARSAREILDFCNTEDAIAPAIAMYHPTKRVLFCRDFVQRQQASFHSAIKKAARIYLIGLRVHPIDEHIWQPLAASTAPLYYVGGEPESLLAWAQENSRKLAFCIADSFADALETIEKHR
jgi:hypothetical protein